MPFRFNPFDFARRNRLGEPDKPTCKMRRWLGRCAAKGHFASGRGFRLFPSAAISICNDGFGASRLEAMEMAAQAGNNVYFDLFLFFSIFFDFFLFILL